MKKLYLALAVVLAFSAGAFVSAQVHDWHDLDKAHKHVQDAMNELDKARAANNYDMQGHGVKAEQHLRIAEHELDMAVAAARGY
ncbi:MAG TPA: hypothetical protein VGJ21_25850 [Terracidiphilus sp.]|jgi:hypothetical protein